MTAIGGTLARPHVWQPGHAATGGPLLLLHGTGGDEHDLLPLGSELAPGASLLSPRGSVIEGSMPRFFRRLREGVFDEDDLRARADELADFIRVAEQEYGITPGSLVAVGFSNGANMAAAMMLLQPGLFAGAVLIAAVPPLSDPPEADLTGRRVLVSNGRRDPMARPVQTETLLGQLRSRGAEVVLLEHDGGHQLAAEHLPAMRDFVRTSGSRSDRLG